MYKNMHWHIRILTRIYIIVNLINSLQVPNLKWAKIKPLTSEEQIIFHLKTWISLKIWNKTLATSTASIPIPFLIKIKHVLHVLYNSLSWHVIFHTLWRRKRSVNKRIVFLSSTTLIEGQDLVIIIILKLIISRQCLRL